MGLVNSISFKFSQDKGRLLENLVFMALKKQNMEIYYHKNRYECDFLVKDDLTVTGAVQVSLTLEDNSIKKREVRGLIEAMDTYNLQQGLIITQEESGKLRIDDKEILIIPVYEWIDSIR
jgi:hypothetical protein